MNQRAVLVCLLLSLIACHEQRAASPAPPLPPAGAIAIVPEMPADVPGGAPNADLRTAGRFAWQQFIAMNWPAKTDVRETPDAHRKFGEPGPVVWATLREKVELYPGDGSKEVPPHGAEKGAPDYGYDDGPKYIYSNGEVPPCGGQTIVDKPAMVNLDEISQVGFNHLFAGAIGGGIVRYDSKVNRQNYRYVVTNKYWYNPKEGGSPYATAAANFSAAVKNNAFPPAAPFVNFPSGTIETKAAFRPLTPAEAASGRFYQTTVRFYEKGDGHGCYREATWGLIGLHIVQKTPTAPAFTWATFEQADVLLTDEGGKVVPVEDDDGVAIRKRPPNTPALSYRDGQYVEKVLPIVRKDAAAFCSDPGARLFYQEITEGANGAPYLNTPNGGNICVEGRLHAIPAPIVDVNREAHRAITSYEAAHSLRPSPWRHYRLVNVQTFPFDKTQISSDPNSPHGEPTYYTANIVVESDYTLQHHSGGPETQTGAAPSDILANFTKEPQPPAPSGQYQNAYLLKNDGSFVNRVNMGGCTGCHGLTQVIAGSDYSYLLSGSSVLEPDFPETPAATLATKYQGRLMR